MSKEDLQRLKEIGRELYLLEHTIALLGWDQETYLPDKGVEERADQLGYLEGEYHKKITSSGVVSLFERLGVDDEHPRGKEGTDPQEGLYLRHFFRIHGKMMKLPEELVVQLTKKTSISQHKWAEARKLSDFSLFAPHLKEVVSLTREKIDHIGWDEHPYDALLDDYEPWEKTSAVRRVFKEMEKPLADLAARIVKAEQVEDAFLYREYPREKQEQFGKAVLRDIGYDFYRGRLDVSAHPFTTTLGTNDVRLTTRYNEGFFNTGFFGSVHEAGHGLYELGFGERVAGNLLATGASLGIHESQSRTWENCIARSRPFWKRYFSELRGLFPESLKDVEAEDFYRAVNKVEPSLIRVEADEVTYNLHIILRFQLELAIVEGVLDVEDLPAEWNKRMIQLLGIEPENDADGVLQDIHWSMGGMGYFPTYALGNLYGAQFLHSMMEEIPDFDENIENGNFKSILSWLRTNIHQYGSEYTAAELCSRITGEPLSPRFFLEYLEKKYGEIYEY